MAASLLNLRVALTFAGIATGICAFGLAGCGRVGPLEPPPGPAAAAPASTAPMTMPDGTPVPGMPQDTTVKDGFDAQGNPVAAPGQKRPFILDPLLQ